MGDSACVMHAFSYTSPISAEAQQVNPIHALTDSISFGRFVTESLEWERWSTFSHKRYVEEAASYAQPGSVAQKKAFFDAHYKKIAAKKASSAQPDQDNSVNNNVSNAESEDLSTKPSTYHKEPNKVPPPPAIMLNSVSNSMNGKNSPQNSLPALIDSCSIKEPEKPALLQKMESSKVAPTSDKPSKDDCSTPLQEIPSVVSKDNSTTSGLGKTRTKLSADLPSVTGSRKTGSKWHIFSAMKKLRQSFCFSAKPMQDSHKQKQTKKTQKHKIPVQGKYKA